MADKNTNSRIGAYGKEGRRKNKSRSHKSAHAASKTSLYVAELEAESN